MAVTLKKMISMIAATGLPTFCSIELVGMLQGQVRNVVRGWNKMTSFLVVLSI